MSKEILSLREAQKLMLSCQMLNTNNSNTLKVIEHLGYVQIDTLAVVERAHHHILWSRNSKYKTDEINQLMKKRKVFEYWSHAASILPMSEYRYSLPTKKRFRAKKSSWFPKDKKMMNFVLKRIKAEGPLQSKDFKKQSKSTSTGWWDWKPAKQALDRLFLDGDLEISYRDSFRKVYDLPENVIPSKIDTSTPSNKEFCEYLINRTLRHHGFASLQEIGYLLGKKEKDLILKSLNELIEDGKIIKLGVKGVKEDYYTYPKYLDKKVENPSRVLILSPFDNLVIQRNKLENIFNFQYQIECYVPEAKRKFGYFALPIFKGLKPIGRIDCKVDRKEKILNVQSIHSENQTSIVKAITPQLKSFTKFNGCSDITWSK